MKRSQKPIVLNESENKQSSSHHLRQPWDDKTSSSVTNRQEREAETESTTNLEKKFIAICSWCKKIRDDAGTWVQINPPIINSYTNFTHGFCPDCFRKTLAELE